MILQASGLRIEIGARVLLDDATFHITEGEKVALVGPNGAGKTTLLKTLVGQAPPSAGMVRLPEQYGWLPQERAPGRAVGHLLAFDHLLAASRLSVLEQELLAAEEQ